LTPVASSIIARVAPARKKPSISSLQDLRMVFPSADKVGDLVVFNIGGNKYRLITAVHFNRGKVYIRHVLTHEDYNTGTWKS
jgi:mRNA interferase HigB